MALRRSLLTTAGIGAAVLGICGTAWTQAPDYGVGKAPTAAETRAWDISISKITRVGGLREGATLEFRTEFFNAFNHPQFNNPAVGVNTENTFGQITSLSVNPRLVQFALKYAF